MTNITDAEQFAMTVLADVFAHTDVEAICAHVDRQLDEWIAEDEATAMEKVIVAYGIFGDAVAHINNRIGESNGH